LCRGDTECEVQQCTVERIDDGCHCIDTTDDWCVFFDCYMYFSILIKLILI